MTDDNPMPAPSQDQIREAEQLLKMLGENRDPEEFCQWLEELLYPERQAEKEAREAHRLALEDFVNGLRELPASYELPEGFEAQWEGVVTECENDETEKLISQGRTPAEIKVLMKRGWISADLQEARIRQHFKFPPPDTHPILVILSNEGGRWRVPQGILSFALEFHPFLRAATAQLPQLSTRERVLQALNRARNLDPTDDPHEEALAASAARFDFMADEELGSDPDEMGWISGAKNTDRFWRIIDAAIGFGRSLAHHDIYRDGSVDALTRRSLLLSQGKPASDWRLFIEEELEAIKAATGNLLTPLQLRKRLGAEPPKGRDDLLVFKDPRCSSLPPTTWPKFQICAKKARQKLDL